MTHSTVSIVWARAAIAADLSLGTLRPHFLFSYLIFNNHLFADLKTRTEHRDD
jgi:hypothetical protein